MYLKQNCMQEIRFPIRLYWSECVPLELSACEWIEGRINKKNILKINEIYILFAF